MEPIWRGSARGRFGSKRGSSHRGFSATGGYNRYSSRPYNKDKGAKYSHHRYVKTGRRMPSRATSPVEGTEEYMTRKIQHTSAIIMRHLLSSDETPKYDTKLVTDSKKQTNTVSTINVMKKKNNIKRKTKPPEKLVNKNKKLNGSNLTAKEIHEKIMNHIANLNEGKKRNFINADKSTGWDDAIDHIQKQQRLEISRILRDMTSSSDCQENGKCSDSVVPDIGIRINELPVDVIEELKRTLNLDLESLNEAIADSSNKENPSETISISSGELVAAVDSIQVKNEQNDNAIADATSEENPSETISISSGELVAAVDSIQVKNEQNDDAIADSTSKENPSETISTSLGELVAAVDLIQVENEQNDDAIADSSGKENLSEAISISSGELVAAVDSIQVKNEQNDDGNNEFVEIKSEDISDIFEENVPVDILPSAISTEVHSAQTDAQGDQKDSIHHEVTIKEEDVHSICSDSTFVFQDSVSREEDSRELGLGSNPAQVVPSATSHVVCESTLNSIESTIRTYVERESNSECPQVDIALQRIDLVDSCIKHLTNYRRSLTQSIITSCRKSGSNNNVNGEGKSQRVGSVMEKSFVARSSQTGFVNEEDHQVAKRQKIDATVCNQQVVLPLNCEIKTEESQEWLENETVLNFPKIQDRIMAIERVDKELLLATETGNIIFINLADGSICHCLDVTQCTITSLAFVKGINDFIYMYVGCLEEVLRVYDFRKRKMLRASHIDDQIRCMDAMWDYVFMGCKNGALIRYSCKKEKIEFEEKNSTDILVLKAAHEGPRRVLIVGHRQAPIYVRDAMSGLYLRNFSNQAISPTVYSLALDNNSLFCGTAKNNILVFSFHEGYLIGKIITPHSSGISCMKIYKNLLFAGCYNGSIYVYNVHRKDLVTVLKGPGGSILCMEVLSNQVVVGTLSSNFNSVTFPKDIFLE